MVTRENKSQSSDNLCKHRQNFIISFIRHQYYQVLHTKFNIRFRRLVLLEMISYDKIFKVAPNSVQHYPRRKF